MVDVQSELLEHGESMDRVTASTSVLLTKVNDGGNNNINDSLDTNFASNKNKQ